MKVTCKLCGQTNTDWALECGRCGKPLSPTQVEISPANIFARLASLKKELERLGCKVTLTCGVEIPLKQGKAKCRMKL